MKTIEPIFKPEQVGRKYETVRYGVHSRILSGNGDWYGVTNYKTLDEARAAIKRMGKPLDCGGLTIAFEGGKERYEYRIVKATSQCEVVEVSTMLI